MAVDSKFQGIALSVLAKLVNGGELVSETEMTITINGKSQCFTIRPSTTDKTLPTTEADKAILARLDSYFARKGTVNAKGERNTLELELACELCNVEEAAILGTASKNEKGEVTYKGGAIRSADSKYRFFRGNSIGVETLPEVAAPAKVSAAPKSSKSGKAA